MSGRHRLGRPGDPFVFGTPPARWRTVTARLWRPRRVRALAALLLAVAGLLGDSVGRGVPLGDYNWPVVGPFLVVPLVVLVCSPVPYLGRGVALLAALLETPAALVAALFTFGLWQLPAVAALWATFGAKDP
ncbi:MAG TPA: hypothetical protein VFQ85_05780 [Mycobacteriales bacterium]|nr:hypothetical protein [Mycobacteriales bacterium]